MIIYLTRGKKNPGNKKKKEINLYLPCLGQHSQDAIHDNNNSHLSKYFDSKDHWQNENC